jgi:cyclase
LGWKLIVVLKKRLIPLMLLSDGRLVKSRNFSDFRDVGDPAKSAGVYSDQNADELVILNVSRSHRTIDPILKILEPLAKSCFMPLALGGGIKSVSDAKRLINSGADKVVVNSATYSNPDLVSEIAADFGSQAVMASVDCFKEGHSWKCLSNLGNKKEEISLDLHLSNLIQANVGEILVQSVDKDGTMLGLDLALLGFVTNLVKVPVIGASGVGNLVQLLEGFMVPGIDAVAVASLFHFTDTNPLRAKAMLQNNNIDFKVV